MKAGEGCRINSSKANAVQLSCVLAALAALASSLAHGCNYWRLATLARWLDTRDITVDWEGDVVYVHLTFTNEGRNQWGLAIRFSLSTKMEVELGRWSFHGTLKIEMLQRLQ